MNTYSIIIILCTIAIGISPFFHTPYSYNKKYKRKHKLVNLFNKKIVKVFYYSFFAILIVVCSELKDTESREAIDRKKHIADSTIVAEVIQAERKSKEEVTKILGSYDYKLDSTNQLLVKIRDKPSNIKPDFVYPEIISNISIDSIIGNTVKYRINIQSIAARSRILELSLSTAAELSGEFQIAQKEKKIIVNAPIIKDGSIDFTGTITNHSRIKMSKIAIRIHGQYEADNKKEFPMDEYLIYDLVKNGGGMATVSIKEELKKVLK